MKEMDQIKELALFGAQARIAVIRDELALMYKHFPKLFPDGPAMVPGFVANGHQLKAQREAEVERKAQLLIAGADQLHEQHKPSRKRSGKKKKGSKAKRKKEAAPKEAVPEGASDPTGETVLVGEAAEMLHVSNASVRNWIKAGEIRVFDTNGPRNWTRLLRTDVHAYGVEHGLIPPAPGEVHAEASEEKPKAKAGNGKK